MTILGRTALRSCLAAALALQSAVLGAGVQSAPTGELSKFLILDNGLKIFLVERRSVPLVNIATAVNCGSKDDPAGASAKRPIDTVPQTAASSMIERASKLLGPFIRYFHFDLPDGVSYTPNTLPSKSIRLSSPDLPARETAKPSSR